MIVTASPRVGQIVREVWKPLTIVRMGCGGHRLLLRLTLSRPAAAADAVRVGPGAVPRFRDNSAYQRWWEGRILWGAMINASRNLSRMARHFIAAPEATDLRRSIVLRQIAYVNALPAPAPR